ncbi:MAG: Cna B-type domain-containing protein, partial [Dermabacter sp.]|nr:Cna B-type domain-containing protein [Dermabacter sp.]
LGGGIPAYYKDGSYSSDRFDPENPGKKQVFDGTARDSDDSSDYRTSISNEGLKTVANAQAKDAARSWARLTISKNKAPRGGGIGSNGGVVFGTPESTTIEVKKEWKGSDGSQLASESTVPVKVQLWASVDGEKFPVGHPVTLNGENEWKYTFTDLPKSKTVDGEQVPVSYTVEEVAVEGFTSKVTGDAEKGFTITNTQTPPTPPTTEVSVNKVWKSFDGEDLDPVLTMPVKVQLTKTVDGKTSPVGEPVELNADNDWTHTFKDLPATKEVEGKQVDITYSTKELGVSGFTFRITGDAKSGFTITNTPTQPPTTEVSVNKVWKSFDGLDLDSALMTPVKVQLMKTVAGEDSTVGEPVELNADNNWAHTFKDLPQFEIVDGKRNQVTYTVKERTIDGFSSKVTGTAKDGFVVSNTQTPPPTTAVDVTKVWEAFDGSQLDASETVPVKVQLLESTGGEKSPVGDPVELNAENGWKYSFTDLPQWKLVDGKKVDVT